MAKVQALHRRVREEAARLPLLSPGCGDALAGADLTRHASRLASHMQTIDTHLALAQTKDLRRTLTTERRDLEAQFQQLLSMLEKVLGQLTQLQSRMADDTARGLSEVSVELAAYAEVLRTL